MFAFWTIVRFGVALTAAVILYLLGAALVRNFSSMEPPDDEPDPANLGTAVSPWCSWPRSTTPASLLDRRVAARHSAR
jgi:hypothetical protein